MTPSEPVFAWGRPVCYVTSAAYGYAVGRNIIHYGCRPQTLRTEVEIEYVGERLAAMVTEEPLYDPATTRLRG